MLYLLSETIDDVASSGRDPDIGFVVAGGSGLFSRVAGGNRQFRGWIYESVSRRNSNGRGRTYHAVLENGLFVLTSNGSGLITQSEFDAGRILGSKSFGYVNFASGYVHFNTTGEAISLLKRMRSAFDLPALEPFGWRS